MSLSPETIATVKATIPVLREHGAQVTKIFYHNLLTENPSLNSMFNQGNQASGHQSQALAGAVLAYASYIDNLAVLASAVKHITHKHASLFVQPEQYDVVGKYLLGAFGQVLGDAFTPQIHDAWAAAYGQLAQIMINAEAELYKQADDWTEWRDFVVKEKIPESSEITSFILVPKDGKALPSFMPGQYTSVRVYIPNLDFTQIRQYSLSDTYAPDHYRISVKKEAGVRLDDIEHPGLVSNVLHRQTNPGDIVQLSRPYGDFVLDTDADPTSPLVLISAGVGVTPMMSMLTTVQMKTPERAVTWIHGANTSMRRAFAEHINGVVKSNKSVRMVRFLSKPIDDDKLETDYDHVGRVDLEKCDGEQDLYLKDISTRYYICGPDAFMKQIKEQLEARGVETSRIQIEKFGTGGF